jgi:ankyrin repeat protein
MKKLLLILLVFISLTQIINAEGADKNCIALVDAARANNLALVKKLLTSVNVDCQNEFGHTSLHYAVMNNCDELLKLLIKHKASALLVDNSGHTPVTLARLLKQKDNERTLKNLAKKQCKELRKNGYLSI